jgi:basic amino acid/polyamine antiporter, APA family
MTPVPASAESAMQSQRKIGLFTATAIVSANMIGTGVFTSLGFQIIDLKDGFSIGFLWLLGGIAALCGALTYGELGAAMPRSGGEYHFLSKIFHPAVGFLSGWISALVGFSAPIAAAAMAVGRYTTQTLVASGLLTSGNDSLLITVMVIAVVTLISFIHTMRIQLVGRFQVFFTGLKISLILILVFAGFILAKSQGVSFLPGPESVKLVFSAPFAVSLVFVMYAYSGWNAATYVVNEIEDPGKNLPRSLFLGTLIVTLLYVPLNLVFLYSSPMSALEGKPEVGFIAANYIFGSLGAIIMGALISLGLISAISSMVWAGPRVSMVMGEDYKLLGYLKTKNKNGVPIYALALQYVIVIILVLSSKFEQIITYIGFTLSLSTFLTVLGVFVLRWKQPGLERPYKTWGYPVTPIIFLMVTGWMLVFVLRDKPAESLAGVATVLLGLVFYFIDQKATNNQASSGKRHS